MNAGQIFDRYQIIRELGRGSMGTVYLALRQDTGQQVALKIVSGGPREDDQERIAVEERGAKLQQQLAGHGTPREPHMISVHRVFRVGADLGIEMEYVEGEDLFTILQRGPMEPAAAARIALALCEMLDNLGRVTPFVHGDLKPRNVRVMRDGQVKVLDFGIAKALVTARPGTWNPWQSAPYCSRERLETSSVDAQSDLWSIGVMLYEMVAGRMPFPVPDEELRQRLKFGPDPLPSTCPEPLRNVVFRMLAPEPAGRYRDPGDCASDLRRFLSHDPVLATDPDARTRRTIPPTATPPQAPGKRWLPTIRLSIFGAVVLAVVVWSNREFSLWRDAGALRGQLESHQIDAAAAWPQYKDLEKRSGLLPVLRGLRQSLKTQLVQKADDVIEDYRRDQPTAREGDWSRAAKDLEHALELDPGDQSVTARLDLCEGHLLRIRAHGWVNRQRTLNQRMLNSAAGKFEDAARLTPDSADPYLGLARIYLYDLHEYEKGVEMLGNASSRGHPVGPREKEQMADALRERGLRLFRESWQFRDMPDQRKTYLQMARENLQSASQQYSSLGDFTPAADAIYRDLLRRVAQVERELATLDSTQAALRPVGQQP